MNTLASYIGYAVLLLAPVLLVGCNDTPPSTESDASASDDTPTFTEPYRPQFHYTPPTNWMNDPNGLVYHEGTYHLFHQYNPEGIQWGHMSWYHATSEDLVHWEHEGVAIPEEGNEMIFSGSALVDHDNTSGFADDGDPAPMVAVYTSHYTLDEPDPDTGAETDQAQSLAYSLDGGDTWQKYAGNPVLTHNDANFRDPNVSWHEESEQWIMTVALPEQHKVQFYASDNLTDWTHLSDFGPAGATTGIWECPDLFELPVDGDPNDTRWVLQVDLNPGAIAGGSGAQYFVGDFDGETFTLDEGISEDDTHWVDYGTDFYAAISWNDIPEDDGRRLWVGWMSNWDYANDKPTSPWRSAQSIPRSLHLTTVDDEIRLTQQPVEELHTLRDTHTTLDARSVANETVSLADDGIAGTTLELVAEFEPGDADAFGLNVRTGNNEETVIGYDTASESVYVDRTNAGEDSFHDDFAQRHDAPLAVNDDGRVKLHVFVDWSSVEVFANDGARLLTHRIFPDAESDGVSVFAEGGTAELTRLESWTLNSIWAR
ncbi:glycoside hydrolase [Longimonas halophila]|uniref:Glycoside hydrolase n=1 Tax=Longimonas halophila TaxID=1469170 RepID=A0A2H3NUD0_9BACT|nr:glycoside hydrolase family 32 protein [Longimonas halophila]PEN07961.1 glycoside hydrolase [Longimonas halophila]